jgi:glutaredoxin
MKNPERPDAEAPYRERTLSALPRKLVLTFHPGGEPKASQAMEGWVKALVQEGAGKLSCAEGEGEGSLFLPSLSLRTRTGSYVHYHFVPEGPEVSVFRECLWEAASQGIARSAPSGEPAEHKGPAHEMLLFVSAHCPNCPYAVRTVQSLARKLPNLTVHLLEAMQHTDLAKQHNVQSVPSLLIDDELRYVGDLEESGLLDILGSSDSTTIVHEKIRKQIKEEGGALEAAEWIASGGDPSFLATDLGESTFEERIALLVALEEALETDPRCLDRMVDPLLPHLDAEHASVRGDIADLLGKIGDRKALPALKRLLEDPDPNVSEVAEEAIEAIKGRS